MSPSELRRQQIEKLLEDDYQLKLEIEQRLTVTTSPTKHRELRLELKSINERIKELEDEYDELTSPVREPETKKNLKPTKKSRFSSSEESAPNLPLVDSSPSASLGSSERSQLRQFLAKRFSLGELKNLAFDLSVDYESFPHATKEDFSRELLAYFERRGTLSCLLEEVLKQRDSEFLVELLARLSSGCSPRKKVQVILRDYSPKDRETFIQALALLLNLQPNDVMVLGIAHGSVKVLVGLPEGAAQSLTRSAIRELESGKFQIISIILFDSLGSEQQEAWRLAQRDVLLVSSNSPEPRLGLGSHKFRFGLKLAMPTRNLTGSILSSLLALISVAIIVILIVLATTTDQQNAAATAVAAKSATAIALIATREAEATFTASPTITTQPTSTALPEPTSATEPAIITNTSNTPQGETPKGTTNISQPPNTIIVPITPRVIATPLPIPLTTRPVGTPTDIPATIPITPAVTLVPTTLAVTSRLPITVTQAGASCTIVPARGFGKVYTEQPNLPLRLGCPTEQERPATLAYQSFTSGFMFYDQFTNQIFVFYQTGSVETYPNTFQDSDPTPSTTPNCRVPSVRGFGKIWFSNLAVSQGLGCPVVLESSSSLSAVQNYEQGLMLFYPNASNGKRIYVVFNNGTYLDLLNTFN